MCGIGDSFSTGDVLLEIETDKAQMDVEAQDEGIMAKIMVCVHRRSPMSKYSTLPLQQPDGTKGVKVGARIAVLAESGDDLSTLSIPSEDKAVASSPQEETKSGLDPSKSSESQAEALPSSKGQDTPPSTPSTSTSSSPKKSSGKPSKQTYPLYPSVAQLLRENGIPVSDADKIPASGPKGRLLKGDVLAFLGTITSSYSSDQSSRISKLAHLDLSNIKTSPPKSISPTSVAAPTLTEAVLPEPDTEVAVSISLKAVRDIQQRIRTTLGIDIPLSTFVARAVELSNDDLPRSSTTSPTSTELFNQVLGLDKVSSKTSRGDFIPQIIALPNTSIPYAKSLPSRFTPKAPKTPDIIDLLTSTKAPRTASIARGPTTTSPLPGPMSGSGTDTSTNIFSVSVGKGKEKRARVFLERVKTVLQVEPGRLVI